MEKYLWITLILSFIKRRIGFLGFTVSVFIIVDTGIRSFRQSLCTGAGALEGD